MSSEVFPPEQRLSAMVNDLIKQRAKSMMKTEMLNKQIRALKDAIEELEKKEKT